MESPVSRSKLDLIAFLKTYFISNLVSFIFNPSCLILRLSESSNEKHCKMIKLGLPNLKRSWPKLSTMSYSLSYPHSARSFVMDPLDLLFDFLVRLIGLFLVLRFSTSSVRAILYYSGFLIHNIAI
jgi:hypothetical protein